MTFQRTGQVACHVRVRDIAKAAAGQLYESMMGENRFFEMWKQQNPGIGPKELEKRFIDKNWPQCLDIARATLTCMLQRPEISDMMKDDIMDILEKDQYLRASVPLEPHRVH